ncbi:cholesteryl ester transfer protein isoform X2 [Dunckerocampus dactyliophorus]|uniref:cholesteryl ester transfer protein isoform X2 n=1 Tax=Dunckerocampus dactyliophorus TaxID=161453 RepID=UPI002406A17E|nr:cholesteryl ester transfer protein isoform X2 [Dunckerocampus dactyliophorus]
MMAGRLPPWILVVSCLFGTCDGCLPDARSAYASSGAVCRLTYPAAVVLNEKTTKVMEAAFQHARYPSVKAEKSVLFLGTVSYGLDNLEIHNLTIGRSSFKLVAGEGISMEISNISAIFDGTIRYGYGSWLASVNQSVDFEIESQIDLGIHPKLYCGQGKVAADTSSCYLNFDKLRLHLQGDKRPNWLKRLFTDFIMFTVKLVIKAQICKEINKVANILADFIQERAEEFLSDGDISVDIGVTTAPVITANYIESYHKGFMKYKNTTTLIHHSVFNPSQLTDHRMLYFWISDQVLRPMVTAAHQDGRFQLNIAGTDLTDLFKTHFSSSVPDFVRKCLLETSSPQLHVRTSSPPHISTSTFGTTVRAETSGRLRCGAQDTLVFQTVISTNVTASYADKHLFLHSKPSQLLVRHAELYHHPLVDEAQLEFVEEAVMRIGIPKVLSVLEREITRLLDKQGVYLFDIYNPEVLPHDGFVLIQMDFGFPHHLLVDFLKRTLQSPAYFHD